MYFVRDVIHLKMYEPKYCDKQLTPYSEKLIKILMEMQSFIQNLGLLPFVLNVPKIGNFQGNPLTIHQDTEQNI